MNKYPWLRLYTESRNDSKLDALNDREFRIWFKLLCLAAESKERGTVDYIDPEFVALELRLHADELESAISRMIRLRLVVRSEAKVIFPAWESRQYDHPSDAPDKVRERVRKSRAKKGVTNCNEPVSSREDKNRLEKKRGVLGDVENSEPSLHDPVRIAEIMAEAKAKMEQAKIAGQQ